MTSSGVSRQRWGSLLMRVSATGRSGTTQTNPESDDLHRLDQWADIWQIIFKPEKCYITNINKHTISHHQYTLKGTPLSTLSTWIYTSEWRLTANSPGRHTAKRWKTVPCGLLGSSNACTTCNSQVLQSHCIPDSSQTQTWIWQHSVEPTNTGQDTLTGVCTE